MPALPLQKLARILLGVWSSKIFPWTIGEWEVSILTLLVSSLHPGNFCFLLLHLGKGLAGEPLSVAESEVLYVSEFNLNTIVINNMTFSMSV